MGIEGEHTRNICVVGITNTRMMRRIYMINPSKDGDVRRAILHALRFAADTRTRPPRSLLAVLRVDPLEPVLGLEAVELHLFTAARAPRRVALRGRFLLDVRAVVLFLDTFVPLLFALCDLAEDRFGGDVLLAWRGRIDSDWSTSSGT